MTSVLDLVDPIGEDDVAWVADVMRLRDLDAPRCQFLTSLDSMDVSACPGSGKTTLVVAKLAILARKWKSRTRGICVLSHTNVARKEIEERLAATDVGHLLLGYPHYIDTIHGFVNRFLAIPWLLSHGHDIAAIDNDITAAVRRRLMGKDFVKLRNFLDKKNSAVEGLRLRTTDFADPLGDSNFPAGRHTESYKIAAAALSKAAEQGYFCHDEMLLFGEALLKEQCKMGMVLASRFPFVLLDEMQDTSARQCRILESALPSARLVCVQRVGDPNQAIFEDEGAQDTAPPFPDPTRQPLSLPSSFRFDSSVASRADGLAVQPVKPDGLQGLREPTASEPVDRHVLFVFTDNDTSQVIPAFASHVAAVMDAAQVDTGAVATIGEVHRQKENVNAGDPQFPATLCHYWDGYHPSASSKTARPTEFVNYARAARASITDGRSAEAVDLIASGIARLANMLSDAPVVRLGARPHRSLERGLATSPMGLTAYRNLLLGAAPGIEDSNAHWAKLVDLSRQVAGALLDVPPSDVRSNFLAWVPATSGGDQNKANIRPPGPNIYQVQTGERTIDVRMSSIHAVKGETHFATLVVETFYHSHAIKSLLPWLTGEREGAKGSKKPGVRELRRLRMNYVALTRATHVVCLAVPASALGDASEQAAVRSQLEAQGWRILELTTPG